MNLLLVEFNGPNPGRTLNMDPNSVISIGRDPEQTLSIDDQLCSRQHARIWFEDGHWYIEDCRSRNGTYLNSQPIERGILSLGDLIRVGERILFFVEKTPSGSNGLQPGKLATNPFVVRVRDPEDWL